MVTEINRLICRYKKLKRLYSKEVLGEFMNSLIIAHASYSNTTIEGTRVTLDDTYDVFEGKHLSQGKEIDEQELINYKEALNIIRGYKGKITSILIKNIHAIILDEVFPSLCGKYREDSNISIDEAIEELTDNITNYFRDSGNDGESEAFTMMVKWHITFEKIHPFKEGNGRVGRIIFSNMMERIGLPPLVFSVNYSHLYHEAIKNNDAELLEAIFIKCYENIFDIMEMTECFYE